MGPVADLLTRQTTRSADVRPRAPWLAALAAAGWSALAGLALVTLPALGAWLAGGVEEPLSSPLWLGAQLWLVGQHVPLQLTTATLSLTPWGLTLPLAILLHGAGRWAAATSGVPSALPAVRLSLGIAVLYALAGAGLALAAGTVEAYLDPLTSVVATGALALSAAGSGVLVESGLLQGWWDALPTRLAAWLRAGAAGAAALVAGGAALVTMSLLLHAGRMHDLLVSLDAGPVGGGLVTVLSLVLVPNAALWGASYALGPGFAMGAGTSVAPGDITLGPLPALPVLAGLPAGDNGALDWAVLVVPVTAGVVTALVAHRWSGGVGYLAVAVDAVLAGLVTGLLVGAMAAASGGSAGPGRLADVGPDPGMVALYAAAEVAIVAVLAAVVLARWDRLAPEPLVDRVAEV